MELFQGHLAAFLNLGFIFAVLAVLDFDCRAYAAGFKLDFGAEYPFLVELVVEREHEARDGDGIAVGLGVAGGSAGKAVDAVVHELGEHLAVAAETEAVVAGGVGVDGNERFFLGCLSLGLSRDACRCTEQQRDN